MVTAVNSRDVALQATSPRIIPISLPTNLTIDFAGVTGTTKPDNNATKNTIYRQASAPTSPNNGDIWVDTSAVPNLVKTRIAGAWQTSASYTTNTNQLVDGNNLGGTATWGGVTGTGKPADDATVNRVTRQATAPTSPAPVNGDIWIDTLTTPNIIKTRIGGAWVSSGSLVTDTAQITDGGQLGFTALWTGVTGTGKPSNYADVTTTILTNSGTSIVMTNANLFKSAAGTAGVFIGSAGIVGKNSSGVTTFAIDGASGEASFAGALSAATGTFAGSLQAATGTFAGSLSAATGSFAGSLSAATGSFAGSLSAATGTFGGILQAATGSFSGSLSAATGSFSGSLVAATGTFGGILQAATGSFSGSLTAATGTFAGSLQAATGSFSGSLNAATGSFAGSLSAATGSFSGTMSANGINGGTFSGASIAIASSAGGWLLNAGYNGVVVNYRRLEGYNIYAGNLALPGTSPLIGDSGTAAAGVYGICSHISGHGVRGEAGDALGFVGYSGGSWDFYAYGTGTYGPFTGAHDALIQKGTILEIGDIVCDVGVLVKKSISNTICEVAACNGLDQSAAVGVICSGSRTLDLVHTLPAAMVERFWTTPPEGEKFETLLQCPEWYDLRLTHDLITMNAVGEGQVNVCGLGGDLQPGDLITTSSIVGKGQKQGDNIVRSHTVAKCRETVTFDFPTQVRMVSCIYLCG